MRLGLPALVLLAVPAAAQPAGLGGKWQVTLDRFGQRQYARLELKPAGTGWTGEMYGDTYTVSLDGAAADIRCTGSDKKSCGALRGELKGGAIAASGDLYGAPVTWTARRAPAIARSAARHEFAPKVFHNHFSGAIAPALRIRPGDTVHTETVDAGGVDAAGAHRAAGGNPLTGPFYIEGAWPGDTLVIRLNRVRLNRDTAGTYSNSVVLHSLDPYYARDQKQVEDFDSTWKLDRAGGVATLAKPAGRLKEFQVKLAPMLGCIGVAPPAAQSFRSGWLGDFGGNLDYSRIREGSTVYLPVYQPGALLFVGDGHAAQGDGELTGNALETSMEIEFTVDLEQDSGLDQPRVEDAESVMALGIGDSLDDALRAATTGMSRWLESAYKLNQAEIAMVLGSSMRYDIAEIVDPRVHVVARLAKSVLRPLGNPERK